ncbi:hypothetical protein AGDE_13454 [Angomonas deanei]|uniref:Uncharacterized protein n=1 Tax=Angomonas deanei TaxID=59799 RepID=A0A7G2CP45_9TRYP|nr:hypothetical protein AGDE_13454 [Angomonas deanei]CAD2219952.1 hypothetical protein, conserved [Angomonas deanei]|eukprot:EPY22286.1 hypothetical protein AGDE_13454 [Angomonas deanei]
MRICQTEAQYRSTFIEVWARRMPLKVGIEPVSYMMFARNEFVPERAEAREKELARKNAETVEKRDKMQRDLYNASLSVKDVVFERVSDEALHRPDSGAPPKLPSIYTPTGTDGAVAEGKEGATSTGEIGHMPTTIPRLVRTSNDRFNKLIFPLQFPPAAHKFNRSFVDAGYQRQRAITPTEMLVVREETNDIRKRFMKAAPHYLRVVRDPSCRGKIQADFCTPEGDLITGRIYRRFYGDRNRVSRHSTMRWQHIGGWKLLKRIRSGSLFPNDVPMYAVRRHPQVDFPNTLIDVKYSTVEKTAMQYGDSMHYMETPDEDLTRDEIKMKRKIQRDVELQEKAEKQLEELFGGKITEEGMAGRIDAKREITPEQWTEAVKRAKIKTVQQTKKTIHNAAKMRAARRQLKMNKRNFSQEMKSNRKR